MASRTISQCRRNHLYRGVCASVIFLIAGCAHTHANHATSGILLEQLQQLDRAGPDNRLNYRGIYPPGIELTKQSEGFVAKPYNDAVRYCTIAYGHLIKLRPCDGTEPAGWLRGMSNAE